ncbi:MAG: phospho-N-acetylmuramoyl-pentapeptide-transferase [bacterium]|nr:phospho-N-acetylmuramoyl-pentapeptide-transferase [bacterium]
MTITRGQTILFSALIASAILTYLITWMLSRNPGEGSVIRDQGPKHHTKKRSTPSTGGRAFLVTLALIGFPASIAILDPRAIIGVAIGLLSGLIGLADDLLKVMKHDSSGLKARYKLPLQIIVGLLAASASYYFMEDSALRIPFIHQSFNLGAWKIIIGLFCYLAIINGVNFTDGLDGLASATVLTASLALGIALWTTGLGTAVVPVTIIGICIGFLPFNWNPAKIFMGDSGALTLGGALAASAIATGLEVVLLIIGMVFIIEISSVVLQVVYFRLTGGKRIFRMTPIHHAWELRGFREPRIVAGAVVLGVIFGLVGWWSA